MHNHILFFLIMAAMLSGNVTTGMCQKNAYIQPVPPELDVIIQDSTNWWMQNSWHFNVYGRPLSQVYEDFNLITDSLERSLDHVCKLFRIRDAGLISWYGLPGPVDSLGSTGKAYPDFGIVLSTYNDTLRHYATRQVTQVLLGRTWGTPKSPFMEEGVVAMVEEWVGFDQDRQRVQDVVANLANRGKIPSIDRLVADFDTYPKNQSYSVAASFLSYLFSR
ncbi:hypothetical protein AMJ86_03890, partial [bacterium SM23_57]